MTVYSPAREEAKARGSFSVGSFALRLLALAIIDALAMWLIIMMFGDGNWQLATTLLIITLLINAIFLREELYPLRWMAPGLALLLLMVIYPIIFTVYIGFTNYGDGHLLTKQETIKQLGRQRYLPAEASTYSWTAFRSGAGSYLLVLRGPEGDAFVARPDGTPIQPLVTGEDGIGPLDEEGIPTAIEGYSRLTQRDVVGSLRSLSALEFGAAPDTIQISTLKAAARYRQKYTFDPARNAIVDNESGTLYAADERAGTFISETGSSLNPGYRVEVGPRNFQRIFSDARLRGPFMRVFVWTFVFAFFSVLLSFGVGLAMALLFNDPRMPFKKLIRSLLIIPYTIPAVISVLIWRGLLNEQFGIVNQGLQSLFHIAPQWFTNPTTAKLGILLINLWLGYPYMMLISSGALTSIPSDIYEAAAVDGATGQQSFWRITLPLLLVSLGPLLISSFAFNFNNFNIIFLYAEGGPPIAGAQTPAGHTDILMSYTYRLAFAGGRGADYGFASAITIIIFLLVATVTFIQFRYTKMLEEISENV